MLRQDRQRTAQRQVSVERTLADGVEAADRLGRQL
jgi:hypothetical protein